MDVRSSCCMSLVSDDRHALLVLECACAALVLHATFLEARRGFVLLVRIGTTISSVKERRPMRPGEDGAKER